MVDEREPERAGGATGGLATASVRRILHDLRGPLNTIAILTEVARSGDPAAVTEACVGLARAVRELGVMLDRVQGVDATFVGGGPAIDLAEHVRVAIGGADNTAWVRYTAPSTPAHATVVACPHRLATMLDTAFACAASVLPDGGEIGCAVVTEAGAAVLRLEATGPRLAAPASATLGKLTGDTAAGGHTEDWFRLRCQVEGLGAQLEIEGDAARARIDIRFPAG